MISIGLWLRPRLDSYMTRNNQKIKDVSKFGGVDELGQVQLDGHRHDASSVEAKSQTNLEHDEGVGDAVVIRCFTFQMNLEKPEVFLECRPSKQELFNSHLRGIEMALFRDGMKIFPDSAPRLTFDVKKMQYSIFIAAKPMRGYLLEQRPQTLTEIVHG